ncbi:RloB family protein [Cellulomonas flavigena]|uniref:RloB family protein n=1 Tax=Cellulomonas flavigena TaxID=1711 RepID=UPI000660E097|nr:RloB family protein [Cellulomonas flavigena]
MGRRIPRQSRGTKKLKTRYMVFTEGLVTERQYLELLRQHLRPRHATFSIKPIGKDPSRVFTEYRKAERRGDFDRAILVVDVDQHHKLDEVLRDCRSSTSVDAIVTNPCFELWLLWHATDRRGYTETRECVRLARINNLTGDKDLNAKFPIASFPEAVKRAQQAWSELAPNKKGPNPSSAMPWLIDLMTSTHHNS